MSLLSRIRSWLRPAAEDEAAPAPDAEEAAPITPRASPRANASRAERREPIEAERRGEGASAGSASIDRLARVGRGDGPSVEEALALLRQVRGTVHEAAAISSALRGDDRGALPEPIRVACAELLAARGDEQEARAVLEGTTSIAGLVLAADLHAAAGQLARAVGTIERVLARDLGAPGARERHQRWTRALGYAPRAVRKLDEATVVAPQVGGGPFRLLREVARGGAGAVYEAEDGVLGRRVAFKVYHGRGRDRALLEREARTSAALVGPGIVRLFDADPGEGWIALEWVARGSIRDLLRAGDLAPLAAIARWARPLARALARIHAAGLVHADIKPANVLLRAPHDPVLGDFGIVRPIGAPGEGGSPGYISPERLAGRASDPRDDVYGFGRVLEDVLHRVEAAGADAAEVAAWRALAMACIGPDEQRPVDGADLVCRMP